MSTVVNCGNLVNV